MTIFLIGISVLLFISLMIVLCCGDACLKENRSLRKELKELKDKLHDLCK